MTKEERQKQSEELKAERKAKALQRKKAKEEKDQEKVWLKREEHKAVLKRAKELLSQTEPASTVVRAEDVPFILEALPEPSTSRQGTDPLETSLVESGPLLIRLNPFPSEEDEAETPSVPQFKRSTVQTETVSQITTESYIQTPAEPAPATTSKTRAAKKIPKKGPSKSRPRPGAGALNYTPSKKDYKRARKAGDILPAGEKTPSRYRPGSLALQEVSLKTLTFVPSMPKESRSCPRTSNWQDVSEVREINSSLPPSSSQHPGPFQGHPIPPKGIKLEKL